MEGYIENVGRDIEFAFKRHIRPGQRVDLEDVYKLTGFKQGMKFDSAFVEWLKTTKVNKAIWNVVVTFDESVFSEVKEEELETLRGIVPGGRQPGGPGLGTYRDRYPRVH